MLKKTILFICIITSAVLVEGFVSSPSAETSIVRWYTFGEAVQMQKKQPRMIMVDVYTNWCGPCKMMSKYTFEHPVIAKYLNENFYPVKFNAETRDSVKFNNVVFVNNSPPENPRPVHDFASSILDGKLMYPSIVFLNEQLQRAQIISGYHTADQFEPMLKYFGSGSYKSLKFDDYKQSFVPEIKPPQPTAK